MNILRRPAFLLFFTSLLCAGIILLTGTAQNAHARFSETDPAAEAAADETAKAAAESARIERIQQAVDKKTLEDLAEDNGSFEPSAAAKAAEARRIQESGGNTDTLPTYQDSNGYANDKDDIERVTNTNRGSLENRSVVTEQRESREKSDNSNKGLFSKIFGKGGFFSRLFSGNNTNNSETNETRTFPTSEKEKDDNRTKTTTGSVDLVPVTSRVSIGKDFTIFSGQIKLAGGKTKPTVSEDYPVSDPAKKTCNNNGTAYAEGDTLQTLINPDGSQKYIADASFTCRSGEWNIEGGLPVQEPETRECTQEYEPVCGIKSWSCDAPSGAVCNAPERTSLETTYSNKCVMEAADATLEHEGPCEDSSNNWSTSQKGDVLGARTTNTESVFTSTRGPGSKDSYVISDSAAPRANDSDSTVWQTDENGLTHQLLIDYSCDGSVDIEQAFTTPYKTLRSGSNSIIPLSVRAETGDAGNHCFAFKIDTANTVRETNESNNQTPWHNFTVESGSFVGTPIGSCALYQEPICSEGKHVVAGNIGTDGCMTAPQCVSTNVLTPDDITLQVKSYEMSEVGGVPVYTLKQGWTSEDITVDSTDKLYFSWDAPEYSQCLTDIHPVQYDFSGQATRNEGNTESSNHAVHTLSDTYTIECTTGATTHKQAINITIQ